MSCRCARRWKRSARRSMPSSAARTRKRGCARSSRSARPITRAARQEAGVDERAASGIEKEDVQVIEVLVRRVLTELAEVTWGHNTTFHRHWTLTQQGT